MPYHLQLFQIEVAPASDLYVIHLRGELDLAGCAALEGALEDAERSGAQTIVLDLEELTFTDSFGLTVLLSAVERSAADGDRLRITPARGQVARVIGLTGLDSRLPVSGSEREVHADAEYSRDHATAV